MSFQSVDGWIAGRRAWHHHFFCAAAVVLNAVKPPFPTLLKRQTGVIVFIMIWRRRPCFQVWYCFLLVVWWGSIVHLIHWLLKLSRGLWLELWGPWAWSRTIACHVVDVSEFWTVVVFLTWNCRNVPFLELPTLGCSSWTTRSTDVEPNGKYRSTSSWQGKFQWWMWSYFQSSPTPTGNVPSSDWNVETTEHAFEGTAHDSSSIPHSTSSTNHGAQWPLIHRPLIFHLQPHQLRLPQPTINTNEMVKTLWDELKDDLTSTLREFQEKQEKGNEPPPQPASQAPPFSNSIASSRHFTT